MEGEPALSIWWEGLPWLDLTEEDLTVAQNR